MGLSMRWDLSPLYTSFDSKEFTDDTKKAEEMINEASEWAKINLADKNDPIEKISYILDLSIEVSRILYRIGSFAHLTIATDATNKEALSVMDKFDKIELNASNVLKKCTKFLGSLDNLDELIKSSKKLSEFEFFLKEEAMSASHLLSDEIEPIISELGLTGGNAFSRMRDMIDGTMMVEIEQDGKTTSLPLPIIRNMAYDPDPKVRLKGYNAELAAYKKIELPLSHSLNAIKGEGLTMCKYRKYDSLLERGLEDSRMDSTTLNAMMDSIVEVLPDFRRYLKAKAKLLGHKKGLPFYDLFAPLSGDDTKKYTYDEAHKYLVDTFKDFSSEVSEFIDNAFKKNWIDAESRPGKGGGAFCANLHVIGESRILSNFDGSFSQIGTLAHELGHAWHGHCLKDLPNIKTSYPMPLAETASIFNETVVLDKALENATEEEKFALIESELMDATQVIVDIYSRYLFESYVIDTRKDHNLSVDELNAAMIDAQKKSYGDGLDEDFLHPYMWACKSHYYIPSLAFYNWPYAFGLLFAKGIFAEYKKTGPSFIDKYKDLLASTGSLNVIDVAKQMNIDVTKKDFWRQSLNEVINKIDIFCELVEKKIK